MQAAAACVTVRVWPPAVIVPVRGELSGFAAALKATEVLPVPLVALVTDSQAALLVAVQVQVLPVVRPTELLPPLAGKEALDDDSAYVHAAAACVTVKVWPATVIVPLRGELFGFAAALKATVVLPVPLVPLVTDSHAALLDAVQAQSPPVVSATDPLPPPAVTDALDDDNAYVHAAAEA